MPSVDLYTKPACPFCIRAKALLKSKNIPYNEYVLGVNIVKEDIQNRVARMGISADIRTVPQIFYIDKFNTVHYIGGYTDLVARQSILGT